MHWEQVQFVKSVKHLYPGSFKDVSVLEIGSYNVNGSIRSEFAATTYVGVDLIEGPGVDVVASGHEFESAERFDTVVSTECFEHNPFYAETFLNMVRHAREGGMVLFTCASDGRAEHGTRRSEPESSPGTLTFDGDYYCNLNASHFDALGLDDLFSEFRFLQNKRSCDLYFVGFKRREESLAHLSEMTSSIERLSTEADHAAELQKRGDAEQAIERLALICDEAPIVAKSHFLARKAWLHLAAKDTGGALGAVRSALTLGETADLDWQLGTILHARGETAEALEAAKRAATGDPSNPTYAYFLGAMFQARNDLDAAETSLHRALRLNPKLAAAHQQLSVVRMKQQRWAEAIRHAEEACTLAPGDRWIADHLARLRENRSKSR